MRKEFKIEAILTVDSDRGEQYINDLANHVFSGYEYRSMNGRAWISQLEVTDLQDLEQ